MSDASRQPDAFRFRRGNDDGTRQGDKPRNTGDPLGWPIVKRPTGSSRETFPAAAEVGEARST